MNIAKVPAPLSRRVWAVLLLSVLFALDFPFASPFRPGSGVDNGTSHALAAAPTATLENLLARPEKSACPEAFTREGAPFPFAGYCVSNKDTSVLGPFPSFLVEECVRSNFTTDVCEGLTWPKSLYLALRGQEVCDRGATWSDAIGACLGNDIRLGAQSKDAFGPFSTQLIESCIRAGGGSVCSTNRWSSSFLSSLRASAPVRTPVSAQNGVRGIYVSHFELVRLDEKGLRALARRFLAANLNTVYVAVYSDGIPFWNSAAFKAAGGRTDDVNWARKWGRIFREEGLHPVAWFELGLRLPSPRHAIALAQPHWLQRDAKGSATTSEAGSAYLSPGAPGARTLIVNMLIELAAPDMPFEEIQLDHFHWSRHERGREFGYEDVTSEAYFAATGRRPPNDVDDPRWVAFREALLDSLVEQAWRGVKAARPAMRLTACPESVYALQKHLKRWERWLARGHIDGVVTQVYYGEESLFRSQLRTLAKLARDAGALDRYGVAIDASAQNDVTRVERQIRIAREEGVHNVVLWVWHDYGSGPATEANLADLPRTGRAWEHVALQPYE